VKPAKTTLTKGLSIMPVLTWLITLLVLSTPLQALQLAGEARAPTSDKARNQAFAELSESLKIEVKSSFQSEFTSDGYQDANRKIITISELPLLGVDISLTEVKDGFICIALLNSDKSLRLYEAELKRLATLIYNQQKQLNLTTSNDLRYQILNQLLTEVEQYISYETVARLLGASDLKSLTINRATIRSELYKLESAAPTLSIAAEIITRDLPDVPYFVQPPSPQGSNQITKLSRLLRDSIRSQVSSYDDRKQARYYLKGRYEILSNSISVSYSAVDQNGATLASRIVKLAPSAYKSIQHKPTSINFDQLLHQGYVVSNQFSAALNTTQGKENLLFTPGQTIELFAKLNNPGYFYIASHNNADNLSYLIELNSAQGKRAFIHYVNADQVNRWLSLGEFEVSKPYGTENLQMIASNNDLIDYLPRTKYNNTLELFIIQSDNTADAVVKTRGLKPKKDNKNKVKSAEATLSFTTME